MGRRGRAAWTLVAALALGGCEASSPRETAWPVDAATARGNARSQSDAVGWLDGRPLTYGDVGRYSRSKDPEAFARSLEGLVLERVTRTEAEPQGVDVPAAELARATSQRMAVWEQRVRAAAQAQGGAAIDPALWLRRVAGVGMDEFRSWVRRHTEVELLQDRLLRFEQSRSPRVEVSLIVVERSETAQALVARARAGEAFDALARQQSVHASREQGGSLPFPLLPSDINDAAVRDALFRAEAGTVVGPFPVDAGTETFFQIYRVRRRAVPSEGNWERLRASVEAELRARPVDVGEYERWRRRVLLRHGFVAAAQGGKDPR